MFDENIRNDSFSLDESEESGNTFEVVEAVEQQDSFAELLGESSYLSERLEPGQKVKAKVISVSGDSVYVDLGGKSEGVIDLSEFVTEGGTLYIKEGDEIEAVFLSVQDGMRKLTTLIHGYSSIHLNDIRNAHNAGLAINGEIRREVKGGFEIVIGGVRCFCPFSQIGLKGSISPGQTFPFKVLEIKDEGRNIIVSRRALLEQEKQAQIDKLKETLDIGKDVTAKIRSIQKFGAFVDLGGIDGLIPVSEISWARTNNPEDALSIGQEVTARVISLDWDKTCLTLSIKATKPDPWATVAEKYTVDSRVNGTIVRLAPFGAFVNLEPGIDGLIHISNLGAGRRINHPREVVQVGQWIEAYILALDPVNRKISLSMQPKLKPEKIVFPAVGELLEGTIERIMPFGIFLNIDNALTGLIPNSEIGTPRGTDHSKMFQIGTTMKVVVFEVDTSRGKVILSRKGVTEKEEQEEFNRYKDMVKREDKSSSSLGSLGEKLKAKMEEKKIKKII